MYNPPPNQTVSSINEVFDASCRIMVLSRSTSDATSFVDLLCNSSKVRSTAAKKKLEDKHINQDGLDLTIIPWRIQNKYYSADIHFALLASEELRPSIVQDVPALIFVWKQGEPFNSDFEHITRHLTGTLPYVCLAVRIPLDPSSGTEVVDCMDDDMKFDAFFFAQGFEYIKLVENQQHGGDIPGLPRLLDALSTVMWPSMRHSVHAASIHAENSVLEWAGNSDNTFSDGLRFTSPTNRPISGTPDHTYDRFDDPWRSRVSAVLTSPTLQVFGDATVGNLLTGFDDDFSTFISASAINVTDSDISPMNEMDISSDISIPSPDNLYQNLVSDIGSDDGLDEQGELFSKVEIMEATNPIFGDQDSLKLTNVVDALQEVRSEIGKLPDDERRNAAARVTFGLLYGLDA